MSLTAFFTCIVVAFGLIALARRVEPVVEAAPPAYSCPVCEAPTNRPQQRCLGCGAMPDETPTYRDGRVVITPQRLIADGRVVRLDPERTTAVTVARRVLPSSATDGSGCALLVAGTSALVAMLYPESGHATSLVAVAVVALLAAPAFLLYSHTERQELEYAVRVATRGGGASEVYASRDHEVAGTVASQLRQAIARGRAVAAG